MQLSLRNMAAGMIALMLLAHQTSGAAASQFAVATIAPGIFALSEPNYYQHNVSYLVVGTRRALMIDSGASTTEDITRVVQSLTDKPVAVIPTHLHFDHIGGLHRFKTIWMIDVPATRELEDKSGITRIPPERHIGTPDGFSSTAFKVQKYLKPGTWVDLGGRRIQVIYAPGHTRDEIVLYSPGDNMLFGGDFIYPAGLFSGNDQEYLQSANDVLKAINAQTAVYGAHAGRPREAGAPPPVLHYADVVAVRDALQRAVSHAPPDEIINNPAPTGNFKMSAAKVFRATPQIRVLSQITFTDRGAFSYPGAAPTP
jgi:hydroxyacylglutathione hydrolase